MRFRYFDARGNEVSLSTAAALTVKIELGEVTETTLLYDAASDEWAPAGEQEIYRHIVEHGPPGGEPASKGSPETAEDSPLDIPADPLQGLPESAPSTRDPSRRPEAPPLEDFWGPAMYSRGADQQKAMESFDLSLDDPASETDARDRPGASDEVGDDLSLKASGEGGKRGRDQPATGAEEGPSAVSAGEASPVPDHPSTPDAAAPPAEPSVERPAAASSSKDSVERDAAPRAGRRQRSRDASLARLEAIAKEATAKMEREEAARRRGPGPTLADRVAENARKGGQKTGEALKTGAAASARALSEGGKATAVTLGAGIRALGKRARRAGPSVRGGFAGLTRAMGSGTSGSVAALKGVSRWTGSAVSRAGRMVGAAVSATGRALGATLGFAGRAARAVFMAPVRVVTGGWRMLAPIRGRAGKRGRGAVGAGVRGFRRAAFSPLSLGLVIFVAAFLFFTYGGGREAGEELWQATVGIARSVAAETATRDAATADAADPGADASEPATGGEPEGARPDAANGPGDEGSDPAGSGDPTITRAGVDETLLVEFERELTLASEGALGDMIAAMDSLERVFQLPDAPPEEWLGGYYLSHATEFHNVRQYWARYRGYIRSVKAQDGVLYRRSLEARFRELGVPTERVAALTRVADRRFREGRIRRDSLYDAMADVAEAAVDLHDFLAENEAWVVYDPVRPGRVSREPVLEAYVTTPEVKAEMDARLDRILETMELVHGLRPVFTRELQDLLFTSLQAVEAVDTFRLGPRSATPPPDSGGPPPQS